MHDTPEWKKLRKKALDKYGGRCMCCGATENIQVDHIYPQSLFPKKALKLSNLQVLCATCNQKKAQKLMDFRPLRAKPLLIGILIGILITENQSYILEFGFKLLVFFQDALIKAQVYVPA